MTELRGGCHCGNVLAVFRSSKPLEELPLRDCQCTFCRKHAVRTTADPHGTLELDVKEPQAVSRYSFGTGITEFLVCGSCGVYVAAVMERDGRRVATLNVNALNGAPFAERAGEPMDYSAESADERAARRLQQWTPTRLRDHEPQAGA